MRKSTIFILLLIGSLFWFTPTESSRDTHPDHFDDWTPDAAGTGCHDSAIVNTHAQGSIVFNTSWVVVEQGQDFTLSAEVFGFSGDIADLASESSADLVIGFRFLDGDNSLFMGSTTYEARHQLDVTGNSVTPWVTTLTAPSDPTPAGNYTLIAYAVAGTTSQFDWVGGVVRVQVVAPVGDIGVVFTLEQLLEDDGELLLTVRIENMTDVKVLELAIDEEAYESQFINPAGNTVQRYRINITEFTPGTHTISVRITSQSDMVTEDAIEFEVEATETSTSTQPTTSSTTSTTQSTVKETVDRGPLSNPIVMGVLVVVMLGAVVFPWIALRRS